MSKKLQRLMATILLLTMLCSNTVTVLANEIIDSESESQFSESYIGGGSGSTTFRDMVPAVLVQVVKYDEDFMSGFIANPDIKKFMYGENDTVRTDRLIRGSIVNAMNGKDSIFELLSNKDLVSGTHYRECGLNDKGVPYVWIPGSDGNIIEKNSEYGYPFAILSSVMSFDYKGENEDGNIDFSKHFKYIDSAAKSMFENSSKDKWPSIFKGQKVPIAVGYNDGTIRELSDIRDKSTVRTMDTSTLVQGKHSVKYWSDKDGKNVSLDLSKLDSDDITLIYNLAVCNMQGNAAKYDDKENAKGRGAITNDELYRAVLNLYYNTDWNHYRCTLDSMNKDKKEKHPEFGDDVPLTDELRTIARYIIFYCMLRSLQKLTHDNTDSQLYKLVSEALGSTYSDKDPTCVYALVYRVIGFNIGTMCESDDTSVEDRFLYEYFTDRTIGTRSIVVGDSNKEAFIGISDNSSGSVKKALMGDLTTNGRSLCVQLGLGKTVTAITLNGSSGRKYYGLGYKAPAANMPVAKPGYAEIPISAKIINNIYCYSQDGKTLTESKDTANATYSLIGYQLSLDSSDEILQDLKKIKSDLTKKQQAKFDQRFASIKTTDDFLKEIDSTNINAWDYLRLVFEPIASRANIDGVEYYVPLNVVSAVFVPQDCSSDNLLDVSTAQKLLNGDISSIVNYAGSKLDTRGISTYAYGKVGTRRGTTKVESFTNQDSAIDKDVNEKYLDFQWYSHAADFLNPSKGTSLYKTEASNSSEAVRIHQAEASSIFNGTLYVLVESTGWTKSTKLDSLCKMTSGFNEDLAFYSTTKENIYKYYKTVMSTAGKTVKDTEPKPDTGSGGSLWKSLAIANGGDLVEDEVSSTATTTTIEDVFRIYPTVGSDIDPYGIPLMEVNSRRGSLEGLSDNCYEVRYVFNLQSTNVYTKDDEDNTYTSYNAIPTGAYLVYRNNTVELTNDNLSSLTKYGIMGCNTTISGNKLTITVRVQANQLQYFLSDGKSGITTDKQYGIEVHASTDVSTSKKFYACTINWSWKIGDSTIGKYSKHAEKVEQYTARHTFSPEGSTTGDLSDCAAIVISGTASEENSKLFKYSDANIQGEGPDAIAPTTIPMYISIATPKNTSAKTGSTFKQSSKNIKAAKNKVVEMSFKIVAGSKYGGNEETDWNQVKGKATDVMIYDVANDEYLTVDEAKDIELIESASLTGNSSANDACTVSCKTTSTGGVKFVNGTYRLAVKYDVVCKAKPYQPKTIRFAQRPIVQSATYKIGSFSIDVATYTFRSSISATDGVPQAMTGANRYRTKGAEAAAEVEAEQKTPWKIDIDLTLGAFMNLQANEGLASGTDWNVLTGVPSTESFSVAMGGQLYALHVAGNNYSRGYSISPTSAQYTGNEAGQPGVANNNAVATRTITYKVKITDWWGDPTTQNKRCTLTCNWHVIGSGGHTYSNQDQKTASGGNTVTAHLPAWTCPVCGQVAADKSSSATSVWEATETGGYYTSPSTALLTHKHDCTWQISYNCATHEIRFDKRGSAADGSCIATETHTWGFTQNKQRYNLLDVTVTNGNEVKNFNYHDEQLLCEGYTTGFGCIHHKTEPNCMHHQEKNYTFKVVESVDLIAFQQIEEAFVYQLQGGQLSTDSSCISTDANGTWALAPSLTTYTWSSHAGVDGNGTRPGRKFTYEDGRLWYTQFKDREHNNGWTSTRITSDTSAPYWMGDCTVQFTVVADSKLADSYDEEVNEITVTPSDMRGEELDHYVAPTAGQTGEIGNIDETYRDQKGDTLTEDQAKQIACELVNSWQAANRDLYTVNVFSDTFGLSFLDKSYNISGFVYTVDDGLEMFNTPFTKTLSTVYRNHMSSMPGSTLVNLMVPEEHAYLDTRHQIVFTGYGGVQTNSVSDYQGDYPIPTGILAKAMYTAGSGGSFNSGFGVDDLSAVRYKKLNIDNLITGSTAAWTRSQTISNLLDKSTIGYNECTTKSTYTVGNQHEVDYYRSYDYPSLTSVTVTKYDGPQSSTWFTANKGLPAELGNQYFGCPLFVSGLHVDEATPNSLRNFAKADLMYKTLFEVNCTPSYPGVQHCKTKSVEGLDYMPLIIHNPISVEFCGLISNNYGAYAPGVTDDTGEDRRISTAGLAENAKPKYVVLGNEFHIWYSDMINMYSDGSMNTTIPSSTLGTGHSEPSHSSETGQLLHPITGLKQSGSTYSKSVSGNGLAYTLNMNSDIWVKSREVRFTFPVTYTNTAGKKVAVPANEWIDIANVKVNPRHYGSTALQTARGDDIEYKYGWDLTFVALTSGYEQTNAKVEFRTTAKNGTTKLYDELNNNIVTVSKEASHVVQREETFNLVGRIGNLALVSSGDNRLDLMALGGIASTDVDILGDNISNKNTFSTHGDRFNNTVRVLPAYADNSTLRVGYPYYFSIDTIGNYYGVSDSTPDDLDIEWDLKELAEVQQPGALAIETKYIGFTADNQPVDVNIRYTDNNGLSRLAYMANPTAADYNSDFENVIDFSKEGLALRSIGHPEQVLTNLFPGKNYFSGYDYIGSALRIVLEDANRTYIGSSVFRQTIPPSGNALEVISGDKTVDGNTFDINATRDETLHSKTYAKQAQSWKFTVQAPMSSQFEPVDSTKKLAYVICFIKGSIKDDVWYLQTEGDASFNANENTFIFPISTETTQIDNHWIPALILDADYNAYDDFTSKGIY